MQSEHTHYAKLQKGRERVEFFVKKPRGVEAYLCIRPTGEDYGDEAATAALEFQRIVDEKIAAGYEGVVLYGKKAVAEYYAQRETVDAN
jgi:hypothetical protein